MNLHLSGHDLVYILDHVAAVGNCSRKERALLTTKADPDSLPEGIPDPKHDGIAEDSFYHGTIQRLFPKNNTGVVRTSSGRQIPFSYQLVELFGPVKKPQELKEGLVVGYDMSWTSDGLKVTKIKTYRRIGEDSRSPDDVVKKEAPE